MGPRLLATAGVLLLVMTLGGCGGDDPEPKFGPTPTPAGSESGTPTAPESSGTGKEPWERNTTKGAVAFVKHWHDVFNGAQSTGDVGTLRAISASSCVSCRRVADQAESIYANGGFYRSEGWRVLRVIPAPPEGLPGNVTQLFVRVQRPAAKSKASGDAELLTSEASRASYSARVRWGDGEWVMIRLVLLT